MTRETKEERRGKDIFELQMRNSGHGGTVIAIQKITLSFGLRQIGEDSLQKYHLTSEEFAVLSFGDWASIEMS